MSYNQYLSEGVKSFGSSFVTEILHQFYNSYKVPIVSVGCGLAAIESLSINELKDDWILVDPNPLSYHPALFQSMPTEPFHPIDYPTVDQLIKFKPEIVKHCILFLNWCEPNDSRYDYDAIIKLQPLAVLSIFEVFMDGFGSAGVGFFMNGMPI